MYFCPSYSKWLVTTDAKRTDKNILVSLPFFLLQCINSYADKEFVTLAGDSLTEIQSTNAETSV